MIYLQGGEIHPAEVFMKKVNLLGQRFGRLTVISPAESRNGRTYWLCRCDCGKEKSFLASNLVSRKSTSCGCVSFKKRTNISGKQFGYLTAIECVGVTSDKNTLWKCRCDCGNEVIVRNNNLKSGHTTSCGCRREEFYQTPERRIEGVKKSPKTGRFETNMHAKKWILSAPNETVYRFRNLSLFIRNNPELFDVVGTDKDVTKIVKELSAIRNSHKKWHGWTIREDEENEQ